MKQLYADNHTPKKSSKEDDEEPEVWDISLGLIFPETKFWRPDFDLKF